MKMVSVVIPSYGENTDPLRAIDSVFKQTYPSVEVIVVDDNGKGTQQQLNNEAIFGKYLSMPNFHYIVHEKNRGGSAARNTGANASSGEYLCFLDDDDFFSDPDKVKKQIEQDTLLGEEYGGTYSSLNKYLGDKFIRKIEARYSGNIVTQFIQGKTSIGTAAPIIRKKCFEAIGGFDASFRRHQDWEFFARFCDKYQMKAVANTSYDRCYKTNVPKKPIDIRIQYMDKYVNKMKECITSIPEKKLDSLMRQKYVSIVFALIREKKYHQAKQIMSDNNFGMKEYFSMVISVFSYVFHRAFYGSHF